MDKEYERYVMVETESGEWFKFNQKPQDALLIDFPDGTVISIARNISTVSCYLPDEQGIYRYAGDVSFKKSEMGCTVNVFSFGIDSITYDHKEVVEIPFNNNAIKNISVGLNLSKKEAAIQKKMNHF